MPKQRSIIAIHCHEGLANRLRALASAWTISQAYERPLHVIWPIGDGCGAAWKDLFCNDFDFITEDPQYAPKSCSYYYVNGTSWKLSWRLFSSASSALLLQSCFPFRPVTISQRFLNCQTTRFYSNLVPVPAVRETVEKFIGDQGGFDDVAGVHIRRKDWVHFASAGRENLFISPRDVYTAAMERELERYPSRRFFVASDEAEEEQYLSTRFPNRILILPKRPVSRNSVECMQEALADWCLLSRTCKVFAPPYSSFSREASKVRNVECKLVYDWKRNIAVWALKGPLAPLRQMKLQWNQRRGEC